MRTVDPPNGCKWSDLERVLGGHWTPSEMEVVAQADEHGAGLTLDLYQRTAFIRALSAS